MRGQRDFELAQAVRPVVGQRIEEAGAEPAYLTVHNSSVAEGEIFSGVASMVFAPGSQGELGIAPLAIVVASCGGGSSGTSKLRARRSSGNHHAHSKVTPIAAK